MLFSLGLTFTSGRWKMTNVSTTIVRSRNMSVLSEYFFVSENFWFRIDKYRLTLFSRYQEIIWCGLKWLSGDSKMSSFLIVEISYRFTGPVEPPRSANAMPESHRIPDSHPDHRRVRQIVEQDRRDRNDNDLETVCVF